MDYAYSRTSTGSQDGEGGLHLLTAAGIPAERTFFDRGVSGMLKSRPEFDRLCSVLVPGDTVTVPTLSRIGRSTQNVLSITEEWDQLGVGLIVLDLGGTPLDSRTALGRFTLTVLAAVNRLTRDFISEATSAKLQSLKASGVQLGGKRILTDAQVSAAARMRAKGESVASLAEAFQVSPATMYRELSRVAEEAVTA